MTIHVTWSGFLAIVGTMTVLGAVSYVVYGVIMLWLFARGMGGR